MAESATEKELVNQGAGSEHEADAIEGLHLRETVEATQQGLTDQHGHLQEVGASYREDECAPRGRGQVKGEKAAIHV